MGTRYLATSLCFFFVWGIWGVLCFLSFFFVCLFFGLMVDFRGWFCDITWITLLPASVTTPCTLTAHYVQFVHVKYMLYYWSHTTFSSVIQRGVVLLFCCFGRETRRCCFGSETRRGKKRRKKTPNPEDGWFKNKHKTPENTHTQAHDSVWLRLGSGRPMRTLPVPQQVWLRAFRAINAFFFFLCGSLSLFLMLLGFHLMFLCRCGQDAEIIDVADQGERRHTALGIESYSVVSPAHLSSFDSLQQFWLSTPPPHIQKKRTHIGSIFSFFHLF